MMTLVKDQLSHNIAHTHREILHCEQKSLFTGFTLEFRAVRNSYGIFFHCQEFFTIPAVL